MIVMDRKKIGLSLKYKLLFLLTAIPVVSLAIYIGLATKLFEDDKIAYVKDSSVAVARSLATQLRLEINSFVEKIKPIVENYDYNSQGFTGTSRSLFERQDRLDALILFQKSASGTYVQLGTLNRSNQFGEKAISQPKYFASIRDIAKQQELVVTAFPDSDMHLVIATRIGEVSQVDHIIVVGLYRASDLSGAFKKANIYKHYLLDANKQIQLGVAEENLDLSIFDNIYKSQTPEGAIDVDGAKSIIVSYADVGIVGLKVTAIVQKSDALAAVNALLVKSLLFFIALIASTVVISVFASVRLTSALRDLYEATGKIAQGQFDVRVVSTSNDEVGGLADGFNFMAGEVSRLMQETSEKARMASELETVKIVQETLFPESESRFGDYNIVGHFEAASECGGDWWNYSKVGDKLFLWIGDATGHGAPAAMVTSAAKAAASIIEDMPYISPGKALEILNKAIHETAKGKILMTFFIAAVDLKTGTVTYANASHEPPYIIRENGSDKITKKNLEPMIDAAGARLGDKRGSTYIEATAQLNKGDTILFYTDGILDLTNPEGKMWGERQFIKAICTASSNGTTANKKVDSLRHDISSYREQRELVDDITFFVCQHEGAA